MMSWGKYRSGISCIQNATLDCSENNLDVRAKESVTRGCNGDIEHEFGVKRGCIRGAGITRIDKSVTPNSESHTIRVIF